VATAGSNPEKRPAALTCTVSRLRPPSKVNCGIVPPRIDVSVSVPLAVISSVAGSVPRPLAVMCPLIALA
jgi:hypothetical protein